MKTCEQIIKIEKIWGRLQNDLEICENQEKSMNIAKYTKSDANVTNLRTCQKTIDHL